MVKRGFSAPSPCGRVEVLDEIVKAAVALANRKMGALIVIERDTSLKDFVEMGRSLTQRSLKRYS